MEEKEIWKDVVGYEGYYQVSNLGRVKSLKRKIQISESWHSNSYYRKVSERILKPVLDRDGYLTVTLGKGNRIKVHRLVAMMFIANPNYYPQINHKDEDKKITMFGILNGVILNTIIGTEHIHGGLVKNIGSQFCNLL